MTKLLIIAGDYSKAKKWAASQSLDEDDWFSTMDMDEIRQRSNFHVIILDSASELPSPFFEKLYNLAQARGRINRQ